MRKNRHRVLLIGHLGYFPLTTSRIKRNSIMLLQANVFTVWEEALPPLPADAADWRAAAGQAAVNCGSWWPSGREGHQLEPSSASERWKRPAERVRPPRGGDEISCLWVRQTLLLAKYFSFDFHKAPDSTWLSAARIRHKTALLKSNVHVVRSCSWGSIYNSSLYKSSQRIKQAKPGKTARAL